MAYWETKMKTHYQQKPLIVNWQKTADFILNKIDRIRDEFINIPAYQPKQLNTPKFKKFTPVTQSQLAKIIKAMPTKTCKLDVIPTDKL